MNPAERVAQLHQVIEDHNYRYHVLGDPTISDPEFDLLYRELVELEEAAPRLDLVRVSHPESKRRAAGAISESRSSSAHVESGQRLR